MKIMIITQTYITDTFVVSYIVCTSVLYLSIYKLNRSGANGRVYLLFTIVHSPIK